MIQQPYVYQEWANMDLDLHIKKAADKISCLFLPILRLQIVDN